MSTTFVRNSKLASIFLMLIATTFLVACEEKGAAEKMGESIDHSMESARDSYKEGVEEVKDEVDDHS
ncbi:Uncharacterised protein [Zhongshania aliphaticivorans]|uniref:Uncharacterized protein n=1 Tax=Zhongshania aliphaticivorans TaxID=1470434 RepID=A0A5S9N841_9GAMM|nr:hypothetical protein [Zhongshania aliphaticivorans]CAA0079560.1 Uncharacterised protein [Zhongshania aliphaticivorans]CAA0086081.1 Uncharacterised protein [Zhongshania aliphaticivorans]